MVKVCKSNGDETFGGTRGDGEGAPIPAISADTIDRLKSGRLSDASIFVSRPENKGDDVFAR